MISIIIPVHNGYEYTQQCLDSIRECTGGKHEIVVVDNGSKEPFKIQNPKPLPAKGGRVRIHVIRNEKNLGFPKAVNQGVKAAKGDYICILNNDVIVTPHWLDNLMYHLEKGGFDAVGPCSNYVAGMQRVKIGTYDDQEELNEQAGLFYEKNARTCDRVNRIMGLCMLLKKKVFVELGGFDEQFGLGNSEDVDFCFKMLKKGYRIGIARDVYIHHFGHVTHDILQLDKAELIAENSKRLIEKWGQGGENLLRAQGLAKYFPYGTQEPAKIPDAADKVLNDYFVLAKSLKLSTCLMYGLCLGFVRDGKYISGDYVLDVAIVTGTNAPIPALSEALIKMGFKRGVTYRNNVHFYRDNILLDIYFRKPDGFYIEFDKVVYKGKDYPVPHPVEDYLKHAYGNWKVPVAGVSPVVT